MHICVILRFNLLFLKRFWLIFHVAVPSLRSKSLLLLVLLILARAAGQKEAMRDGGGDREREKGV